MTKPKPIPAKPGRKLSTAITFGLAPDTARFWRKTLRRYGIKAAPFYREAIDGAMDRLLTK
jgi:hypothetical protein